MRFDCGASPEEKRVARRRIAFAEQKEICVKKKFFAWFPVRVGAHDCRWMEHVYRDYPRSWVSNDGHLYKDQARYTRIS